MYSETEDFEAVQPSDEQEDDAKHIYSTEPKDPDSRAGIIKNVVESNMPQSYAAIQLGVSVRQVQRMAAAYRKDGKYGLIHKNTAKPSHNNALASIKEEALNLIRNLYPGAGPTLAAEMLASRHNINVSRETLRRWFIEVDLWEPGNIHSTIRRRRTRRSCLGELVQMDTSEHRWLDGDEYQYLIATKDDATGLLFARFYPTDSTVTNMDFMNRYVRLYGRPAAFYLDHASHFKVNPPKEGKADWKKFTTQIQRASKELSIELVFANSPQAKGRIEREFRTLQDRLIKRMKWDSIKTLEEANDYLVTYLPEHNKRFMVKPAQTWDLHRSAEGFDLDAIYSVQETRIVSSDNVARHENIHYQILVEKDGPNLRGKTVTIETRLNGSIKIRYGGKYYNYMVKNAK